MLQRVSKTQELPITSTTVTFSLTPMPEFVAKQSSHSDLPRSTRVGPEEPDGDPITIFPSATCPPPGKPLQPSLEDLAPFYQLRT